MPTAYISHLFPSSIGGNHPLPLLLEQKEFPYPPVCVEAGPMAYALHPLMATNYTVLFAPAGAAEEGREASHVLSRARPEARQFLGLRDLAAALGLVSGFIL